MFEVLDDIGKTFESIGGRILLSLGGFWLRFCHAQGLSLVEKTALVETDSFANKLALAALEGDPRFELIQQRMLEHLNQERELLGLEPVST